MFSIARRLNCVAINFSTAGSKLGQFRACALGSDLKSENPSVLHCLDLNPRFYRRLLVEQFRTLKNRYPRVNEDAPKGSVGRFGLLFRSSWVS
jgi:hypothetical protein